MKLVSVIIVFLNEERFLPEAIESVFAQTFSSWELVLVDDGSTDGSTAIARRYADQNPERVRYFEHPNHQNFGAAASRNLGIKHARGEYVGFVDADDVWLAQKLEQQVAILDAHPEAAMVYGLSGCWYGWTGKPEDQHRDFVHHLGVTPNTVIQPPTPINRFFFEQSAAIPNPTSILIRRETLMQVGGFDETFKGIYGVYEDQTICAKICLQAPVFAANVCWDKYRQHSESTYSMAKQTGQEYSTRVFFLNWLEKYLSEQGIEDLQIWQALRKELWRCRHPELSSMKMNAKQFILAIARWLLPPPIRHWLWSKWKGIEYIPLVGAIRFGDLRRVAPFSREFGFDRGTPIDRYYIERFLAENASDIRGRVLEIADNTYTRRFGGDRVNRSDVLHANDQDCNATMIGDLTNAEHIPSDSFDCVILTQTLQVIYDVPAALRTVHRILKPGGVVLATVPGISPISRYDMERWGHFWAFTSLSARRLFEEAFAEGEVKLEMYGNVLTASGFLYGIALEELDQKEVEQLDPDYQVIIAIRAQKS